MIGKFRGEYTFLSNFYETDVTFNGILYLSSEAAFQAQKSFYERDRIRFKGLTASESKRLGRAIRLRPDWEEVKLEVMYDVCKAKFTSATELAEKLLETGNELLEEGNTWGDSYWGTCYGFGDNNLGKILMKIREELRIEKGGI